MNSEIRNAYSGGFDRSRGGSGRGNSFDNENGAGPRGRRGRGRGRGRGGEDSKRARNANETYYQRPFRTGRGGAGGSGGRGDVRDLRNIPVAPAELSRHAPSPILNLTEYDLPVDLIEEFQCRRSVCANDASKELMTLNRKMDSIAQERDLAQSASSCVIQMDNAVTEFVERLILCLLPKYVSNAAHRVRLFGLESRIPPSRLISIVHNRDSPVGALECLLYYRKNMPAPTYREMVAALPPEIQANSLFDQLCANIGSGVCKVGTCVRSSLLNILVGHSVLDDLLTERNMVALVKVAMNLTSIRTPKTTTTTEHESKYPSDTNPGGGGGGGDSREHATALNILSVLAGIGRNRGDLVTLSLVSPLISQCIRSQSSLSSETQFAVFEFLAALRFPDPITFPFLDWCFVMGKSQSLASIAQRKDSDIIREWGRIRGVDSYLGAIAERSASQGQKINAALRVQSDEEMDEYIRINKLREQFGHPMQANEPEMLFLWVGDAEEQAAAAVSAFRKELDLDGPLFLGIDVETRPRTRRNEPNYPPALLQLSTRKVVALIDLLPVATRRNGRGWDDLVLVINELMKSKRVVKLGIGMADDVKDLAKVKWLRLDEKAVKNGVEGMLDLDRLMNWYMKVERIRVHRLALGSPPSPILQSREWDSIWSMTNVDVVQLSSSSQRPLGLSRVCQYLTGIALNKAQQCSMWHHRPLHWQQVEYAALDAAVSVEIFHFLWEKMNAALLQLGLITSKNDMPDVLELVDGGEFVLVSSSKKWRNKIGIAIPRKGRQSDNENEKGRTKEMDVDTKKKGKMEKWQNQAFDLG